jgi:hypothetical protein
MTDGGMKAPPAILSDAEAVIAKQVLLGGNLAKLNDAQQLNLVIMLCEDLHLNWRTGPIQIIPIDGRQQLYMGKGGTDQLRMVRKITLEEINTEIIQDVFVVRFRAKDPEGRSDEDSGAVPIGGLKGMALANAIKKARTQAKRRVTLSICGLGFLDESELEGISADRLGRPRNVDPATGEVKPPGGNGHGTAESVDRPSSAAQGKVLWAVWRKHGMNEQQLRRFFKLQYDLDSTAALNEVEMKRLIEHLQTITTKDLLDSLARLEADAAAENVQTDIRPDDEDQV